MILNCKSCNKGFRTYPSKILLGKGKYCSKECSSQITNNTLSINGRGSRFKKGERHPWDSHQSVNWAGYIDIYSPNHPNKTKRGYVREHRLVMEKEIGRYLRRDEDVHHINHNKKDNRIENLQVVSHREHIKIHGPLILKRWAKKGGDAL